jgi:hypothetical protein
MNERFWTWLAWHLPKKLVYWATIRAGAHASTGEWSNQIVPEMYFVDVLKRWDIAG